MSNDTNDINTRNSIRGVGHLVRLVIALALVVALVVVALDNTDDVRVGYAIGDASAPIWIVILIAAVAGAIISALIRLRRRV